MARSRKKPNEPSVLDDQAFADLEIVEQLVLHDQLTPRRVFDTLLERGRNAAPNSAVWHRLAELDVTTDVYELHEWLEALLQQEAPDTSIVGFWFGLFTPIVDDIPRTGLYVAGSSRLDPANGTTDWAVMPDWWPEGRYADSRVLAATYIDARDDPAVDFWCEYVLGLGYATALARSMCSHLPTDLLLGSRDTRRVSAGFDAGDSLWIGDITRHGFTPATAFSPHPRPEFVPPPQLQELLNRASGSQPESANGQANTSNRKKRGQKANPGTRSKKK